MQGPDYIFAFQSKDFSFWQPDANNKIVLKNKPYLLDFSPEGWDDIAIQNILNKRYWGIDRSVTIPLSYVQDGAKILKNIVLNKGIEESVYLVIARQELEYIPGESYGYWYKQIYRAEVDFSTYDHSGVKVTCNTLEDGLPKYLKANENTTYEFPMNVPEAIFVKMDGIKLHESINYQIIDGIEITKNLNGNNFFPPAIFVSKEGESTGVVIDTQNLQDVTGFVFEDKVKILNSTIFNVGNDLVNAKITGKIEFTCTGMTSLPAYAMRFRFLKTGQNIGDQNLYVVMTTPAMIVGQTYSQDFDITIPLTLNQRIYLEGFFFAGVGVDAKIKFTKNSKFKINYITKYQTSYIRAFRPQYLFTQLINKVTEGKYQAELATYFSNTKYWNKVITCGNALRGLDTAVLKINFSDFFQFWDSFDAVGIREKGGKVNFAEKYNLIDKNNFIDLPDPANFKMTFAKDFLYNEVEIGYPEIRNDVGVLNGNDEFNTKFLFSIGATKSPAKIDKVSKIKTSCYEIEKIRVTTVAKDSTDYKSDNDLFAIAIMDEANPAVLPDIPVSYDLDRTLNPFATGLNEPATIFNLPFSPKRNLLRNGPFLRSSLYLGDGKILAFKTSDKNDKLKTDVLGTIIEEKADVIIGSLGEKFFFPVLFDLEIPAPHDLISLLDLNPLQLFRFSLNGDIYTGILVKVGISPSSNKAQQYQLLSTADNNLTKLEEFYG